MGTLGGTLQPPREHYPRVYPDDMATLCFALLLVTGFTHVTLRTKLLWGDRVSLFSRAETNPRCNI